MNTRPLFIRASVAAAAVFVVCCLHTLLIRHVDFASKWFGVFAGMLFGACVVSPFVVAFLGRRSQYQWPWLSVFAATTATTAVLGFTILGIILGIMWVLH